MTSGERLPTVGRLVRLRDVTLADAELLDQWNRELEPGSFNDFGPREPIPREPLASGSLRDERNGTFLVERLSDGRPIGTIGWRRVAYGPSPWSDAWQIGIELIPEGRGQGNGAEAQRLVAEWLLATTSANRVEAATDIDNLAEQRSLAKAGYHRDGVMRGAQLRAGAWHDLVYYSRIREDG